MIRGPVPGPVSRLLLRCGIVRDIGDVSALRTPEEHAIDDDDRTLDGREAIQKAYSDLFRGHPLLTSIR